MADGTDAPKLRVSGGAEAVAKVLAARRRYFAGGGGRTEPKVLAAWGTNLGFFKPVPLTSGAGVTVLGCSLRGDALAVFLYQNHGSSPVISDTIRELSIAERFNGESRVVAEMVQALRAP
jgi:hypothetical protein